MNGLRLIVVAAVLLLALAASGVRAKSASDSWNAPVASESWPSLEEFASEIELAHREFESTLAASSSSTGSSSSSSTGPTIVSSTGIKSSSTGVAKSSSSSSTGVAKSSSSSTGVAKSSSSSSTGVKASSSSSSSTGVSASSSSTGVSSSSSSTAAAPTVTTYTPALVAVSAPFNESTVPGGSAAAYADVIAAGIQSLAGNGSTVTAQACFVDADSTASTCPTATDDSSSRRLLQSSAKKLLIVITITPTSPLDSTASIIAAGVATQLGCGSNTTCQDQAAQSMASALTVATGVTVAPVTLNAAITQAAALSNNTDMQAAVAAALVTGFTVTSVDSGVITVTLESSSSSSSTGPDEQANYKLGAPSVATSGHANGTNAGYYVEAAVLALSAILSAMYMVMHKVDPSAVSFSKTQYGSNEAALAPVPSAEPAHGHVSIVNPDEAAPLGSQGQMDYKSVFALRNNVLEHKDHSHAEDNSNQNDVHFILHQ